MNVFIYSCYKRLIKESLELKRKTISSYTFQSMAAYCKIQKTYLSKVINNDNVHLSEDQLFMACEYLQFKNEETEFALLLHSRARTTSKKREMILKNKIKNLQSKGIKTDKAISSKKLSVGDGIGKNSYYLNPLNQIIHMFLTVERYAKTPKLIARDLSISNTNLERVLLHLEELDIIKITKSGIMVLSNNLHLPEDSEYFPAYVASLRSASSGRFHFLSEQEKYNFSVTFSADLEAQAKIKKEFLAFLSKIKKVVDSAPCEDVYQIDFSLFPWSQNSSP